MPSDKPAIPAARPQTLPPGPAHRSFPRRPVALRDTPEFRRGRQGERDVVAWLQARGWHVVPTYDYTGTDGTMAPRLQGQFSGFVVPDLDVSKDGQRLWVEVKTKHDATLHRLTGVFEHGISWRQWRHYVTIQGITGTEVWLFVLEEVKQALLAQRLDALGEPRVYAGDRMDPSGMVFWPRERFHFIASLERREA
jgi:hypothetical protein